MKGLALLLALAVAFPVSASEPTPPMRAISPVVLVHHTLDQVDPFGVSFAGGDTFSARYGAIAAQTGRFAYPVFVADGVTVIQQLPDPAKPFEGTLAAYGDALRERAGHDAPVALYLSATNEGGNAKARLHGYTHSGVQDPQGQPIHLWLAVVEDAIHFKDRNEISNGVTDHRFTVRSLLDAGTMPLTDWDRTAFNRTKDYALPLSGAWQADHLSIAAWLQAGPVAGRFAPNEVVQAISAPLDGIERLQADKGVLLEEYSATWCTPCLYGDLALERLAIQSGVAAPLEPARAAYWKAPDKPLLVAALALAAGAVAVAVARRRT